MRQYERPISPEEWEYLAGIYAAEIPELEITRYAIDLRSVSHGTGSFTRSYLRHEPLPSHLAAKVAADSKPG